MSIEKNDLLELMNVAKMQYQQEQIISTQKKQESLLEEQLKTTQKLNHLVDTMQKNEESRNVSWGNTTNRLHAKIDDLDSRIDRLEKREADLDKLQDFIDAFNAMKWKVITGVGGILILSIWQAVRTTPALQGN